LQFALLQIAEELLPHAFTMTDAMLASAVSTIS